MGSLDEPLFKDNKNKGKLLIGNAGFLKFCGFVPLGLCHKRRLEIFQLELLHFE